MIICRIHDLLLATNDFLLKNNRCELEIVAISIKNSTEIIHKLWARRITLKIEKLLQKNNITAKILSQSFTKAPMLGTADTWRQNTLALHKSS